MSPLATAAGPAPLSAEEVAEMRQHLAFLRRYKEALRLKLNAAEDLLVNGQREPTDRGVCHHLLAKVDRAIVEAAIAREPLRSDADGRARMLAGAIRVTADVGVLVAYLETLSHLRSRTEAAQAFAEVVRRIDFESLSPARLTRLLQVLIDTFADHERVQVLFSLLASLPFRRAFDAAAASFPPAVAEAFAPLRAVHRHTLEDRAAGTSSELLAEGLRQLLSAPDPVLRTYAEPLRTGMLELALRPDVAPDLGDRAAGVLLSSLPRERPTFGRLALRRAAQLLRRHADDRARVVLEELRRAQPQARAAERWLAALGGRRLGRVALTAGLPERGRLAAGWWLDGQRAVWVRTAVAADSERLAREAQLQATLTLPGVAGVVDRGIASGIPYVAVSAPGRPLAPDAAGRLDPAAALALAAAAARVLHALALAGVVLPDASLARFVQAGAPDGALTLADLDGARDVPAAEAALAHAGIARALLPDAVLARACARLSPDDGEALRETYARAIELSAFVRALESAALRIPRE